MIAIHLGAHSAAQALASHASEGTYPHCVCRGTPARHAALFQHPLAAASAQPIVSHRDLPALSAPPVALTPTTKVRRMQSNFKLVLYADRGCSTVLGDNAQQLVVEAHRSEQTRSLLPYNTAGVRTVIRESHSLSQSIVTTAAPFVGSQGIAPTQGVSAELTIAALALNRNKRALYVYHQQRINVLRDCFWEHGGVLSAAFGADTETRKAMTTTDEAFAKGYADLCLAFKTSLYGGSSRDEDGDESLRLDDEDRDLDEDEDGATQLMDAVDLLAGGTNLAPPKELMADVRVVRDVGEVELLSGNRINLKKGAQYHLAREDVEALIVAGDVEVIE